MCVLVKTGWCPFWRGAACVTGLLKLRRFDLLRTARKKKWCKRRASQGDQSKVSSKKEKRKKTLPYFLCHSKCFAIRNLMPLFTGTRTSAPLCLPRKPCATVRPFDSSGAGRGSIGGFQKWLLHPFPCVNDSHNSLGWQEGRFIYISHPQSCDLSVSPLTAPTEKGVN